MSVYFRCKICGEQHPSPLRFVDRQVFEASNVVGLKQKFPCPTTGKNELYDFADLFWEATPNPKKS